MRVFALELDNDRKGPDARKAYIEGLIARLPSPELVVLPELSLCSYLADREVWQLADEGGREARPGRRTLPGATGPIWAWGIWPGRGTIITIAT